MLRDIVQWAWTTPFMTWVYIVGGLVLAYAILIAYIEHDTRHSWRR